MFNIHSVIGKIRKNRMWVNIYMVKKIKNYVSLYFEKKQINMSLSDLWYAVVLEEDRWFIEGMLVMVRLKYFIFTPNQLSFIYWSNDIVYLSIFFFLFEKK